MTLVLIVMLRTSYIRRGDTMVEVDAFECAERTESMDKRCHFHERED